jgi:hypothetical protein
MGEYTVSYDPRSGGSSLKIISDTNCFLSFDNSIGLWLLLALAQYLCSHGSTVPWLAPCVQLRRFLIRTAMQLSNSASRMWEPATISFCYIRWDDGHLLTFAVAQGWAIQLCTTGARQFPWEFAPDNALHTHLGSEISRCSYCDWQRMAHIPCALPLWVRVLWQISGKRAVLGISLLALSGSSVGID